MTRTNIIMTQPPSKPRLHLPPEAWRQHRHILGGHRMTIAEIFAIGIKRSLFRDERINEFVINSLKGTKIIM
jgi:hypothetical protein